MDASGRGRMEDGTKTPLWVKASAVYTASLMSAVFVFIIVCALDGYFHSGPELFGSTWNPEGGEFGIAPMIWGTLLLSVSSLALGWALALGCVCFIHGLGPRWTAKLLLAVLRFMTAVPTVVYGFASVFLLTPIVSEALGGSGFCWLSASLALGVLVTPTMALSMDGAVSSIEKDISLTAASLGFTQAQSLAGVVLPNSTRWLWSSAVLGFGRAAGDTLIPTMLAGNAVQYAISPLDAMRTLTAHIGLALSSDVGGTAYYSLFVAGGILLAVSAAANIIFRVLGRKR